MDNTNSTNSSGLDYSQYADLSQEDLDVLYCLHSDAHSKHQLYMNRGKCGYILSVVQYSQILDFISFSMT